MTIEVGSPEWLRTVTASKIPSILGISRFKSQFALWHEMAGLVDPEPISESTQELFDYGHAAELAAREYWLLRNPGWRASRAERQFTDPTIGFANAATVDRVGSRGSHRRVIEVKTAQSLEAWGDDGSGEVPADYAAQVLFQQRVTGFTEPADLVLWPEYGRPRIYTIEFVPHVAAAIIDAARKWLASIEAGTPPPLDNTVSTYECLRRLHPDIERDIEVELPEELAARYLTLSADQKLLDAELRGAKSEVLAAMGSAQRATCRGHKIADRRNHASGRVALAVNTKSEFLEGVSA